MRKNIIIICLVLCFLSTSVTFAGLVNLAVNNSGTITAATGQVTTFERFNNPPTGTGVFQPFVRIQHNRTERGYNTDGAAQFDTKSGKWTHAIKLGDVQTVNGSLEFLLDINQSQGGSRRFLSLDTMKIFLADSGNLDHYNPASETGLGTKIYDMGNNWVKMDNTIFKPGSGTGDMRVLIPVDKTWSPNQYLYLYTEFGKHFNSNAGFEEWSTSIVPVPEPATITLLGLGLMMLRKRK